MRRQADVKPLPHCQKNGSEVVHAGVTSGRQHPMQAFAGLGGKCRKLLEADGSVDQVTQDQTGGPGFAVEKQSGGLI